MIKRAHMYHSIGDHDMTNGHGHNYNLICQLITDVCEQMINLHVKILYGRLRKVNFYDECVYLNIGTQ